MHELVRATAAVAIALVFSVAATAQRQHVAGLIGEPPDTSNWPHPAAPDGNPFPRSTASAADIAQRDQIAQLGKALFWDEQASSDNTMSCGTCHLPQFGGTDGRPGAVHANGNLGAFGVIPQAAPSGTAVDYGFLAPPSPVYDRSVTPVTPPTMIGAYVFERLFWDSRAGPDFTDELNVTIPTFDDWAALEDLAVEPPLSNVEMGHESLSWSSNFIQDKLNECFPLAMVDPGTIPADVVWLTSAGLTYKELFDIVFASHPMFGGSLGVTRERFAMAVAHYHRTLIPDQAPLDRGTMTKSQLRGFELMRDRSGCFRCHSVSGSPQIAAGGGFVDPFDDPMSDGLAHDIGLAGAGRRKTPVLRNVGLHVKFFSTGHGNNNVFDMASLVEFYNNQPNPMGFDGTLTPTEKAQLRDFLEHALTDPRVAAGLPPFDRPQLYSETQPFEANEFGVGTPPWGSFVVPEIIANSPPLIVQPSATNWWKVGVGDAPVGLPSFLLVGTAPAGGPQVWVGGTVQVLAAPSVNAQGIGTFHVPVPLTTSSLGVPVYAQWMFVDRYQRSFSDAARFVPFHW